MSKLPCTSKLIWDNILCLGSLLEWAYNWNLGEALPSTYTCGSSHLQKARTIWGRHFNIHCIQHYPCLECAACRSLSEIARPAHSNDSHPKEKSVKWGVIKHRCLSTCWLIEQINIRNWETTLQMFYELTLPSIRYVKEVILPLRNFCLSLLLWQELTLFPAFACHSPGNVTKCFSEVHFFPYSQLLFPTKIAASGKGILARADTKGELQSSASFQITWSLIANVT